MYDPPYNTGNDFIYKDDFSESTPEYLERSGQTDDVGARLTANPESNGRFHSDWLSMMYPRLKLARNLLREDGLIFISIDEHELANAKKLLENVFGEKSAIAELVWKKKKGGGNDSRFIAVEHEYVLVYSPNVGTLKPFFLPMTEEYSERYKESDDKGRYFWDTFLRKSGKQYYPIKCPDGSVLEKDENGNRLSWLRSEARFLRDLAEGEVRIVKVKGQWSVHFKQRMPIGVKPRSILMDVGVTSDGSKELLELFGASVFDNPKPRTLIEHFISISDSKDALILDFFAGSCTTGHAVFSSNLNDGGTRNFIIVSLPEKIQKSSSQPENEFSNVSEIGRQRLQNAAHKLTSQKDNQAFDLGFRTLRIDSTNLVDVRYAARDLAQSTINEFVDSIKPDRTGEDLLFQVLLDWGMELSLPITRTEVDDREVFSVDDDALIACFAESVTPAVVTEIAKRQPLRAVFRDDAFESDAARINAEQIFRELSPVTEVRTI